MSNVFALGARPHLSPVLNAPAQAGGTAAGAQTAGANAPAPAPIPAAPPPNTVSLSQQGLAKHVDRLASAGIDIAQRFITDFAASLFGSSAKGASVSFDAASVQAESHFSASLLQASGAGGALQAASFDLSESAHFVGSGQIVTADGQTFEFEIEVRYQANVHAEGAQTGFTTSHLQAPDTGALTGMQLPAIEFPGSLADLFKVLGRELQLPAPSNPARADGGAQGNMTMRLLRLVNNAALLAPRAQRDDPQASAPERAKALADAYVPASAPADVASA